MKVTWNEAPDMWVEWLEQQPHTIPFQSAAWQFAQKAVGKTAESLCVRDEKGDMLAYALCIREPLGFGKIMIVSPRGPVFEHSMHHEREKIFNVVDEMKKAIHRRMPNAVVWRCEPALLFTDTPPPHDITAHTNELEGLQKQLTLLKGNQVHDKQPAVTRILDLADSEEEILAKMKQKTRYNIKQSVKRNVNTVWYEQSQCSKEQWSLLIEQWWKLQSETAARQNIRTQEKRYFDRMLSATWPEKKLYIGVARVQNTVIAMNVCTMIGDTMTYVYGASSYEYRDFMAPYALQWSGIQLAQEQKARYYDFYGIAPENDESHPLAGVSRFKQGFGGTVYQYPGTWEFPLLPLWYTLVQVVKKIRS